MEIDRLLIGRRMNGLRNASLLLLLVSVFGMVVVSAASSNGLQLIRASTEGGGGDSGGGGDDGGNGGGGDDSGGGDGGGIDSGGGDEPEEPEEPEEPPPEEVDPVEPEPQPTLPVEPIEPLPPCDGSAQDCITDNGVICLVGQGGHECECSEDMSDCPEHPSIPEPPVEPPRKPLPYCDLVPDDYEGTCHDRNDYDEITGKYPCNDGTQADDWRDCEDAYVPSCNPDTDPNCENVVCPAGMQVIGGDCKPGPKCKKGYELTGWKCVRIEHKTIIKNINIYKTIHNTADFPEVDVIGLSLKDDGGAMVCMMNIDNDWVQCQEFGVPNDRINENIWRVIETDNNKDYDNANTGSEDVDDAINSIKSFDFPQLDDLDNHDFNVDLAALGINPQGDGLICLIEDDRNEGTALCEPFKVSNQAISGQITEITEISS